MTYFGEKNNDNINKMTNRCYLRVEGEDIFIKLSIANAKIVIVLLISHLYIPFDFCPV